MNQKYSSGNYDKYTSSNKLKQRMLKSMQSKLFACVEGEIAQSSSESPQLLDVGCGEGFTAAILKQNYGGMLQITGIDYSEGAVGQAKKMCPAADFMVGSVYNLPFDDNSMDIVLCSEVLEHLEEPEKGLRELLRVAKHSVILSVPNEPFFRIGNMLALKNVSRLGDPPDHIQHWSAGRFVKWVKKNADGFCYCQKSFPWTISVIGK